MAQRSTAIQKGDQRLDTTVHDPRLRIDMGANGIAYRTTQEVRLYKDRDLYCLRRSPSADDKHNIWGSGCSKIVAAMGGRLEPLPSSIDPETQEPRAGMRWTLDEVSGTIKVIECDAICAVRNPMTGEWSVGVATAYEDIDGFLLRELVKLSSHNGEAARLLTQRGMEKLRDSEDGDGWLIKPYSEGVWLCANLAKETVRDALKKHREFADVKTLAPRIRSKALRHAFLANPVTRQYASVEHGYLRQIDGPPCWRVMVKAWIEHVPRNQVETILARMVAEGGFNTAPVALLENDDNVMDMEFEDAQIDDDERAPEPIEETTPVRRPKAAAKPQAKRSKPAPQPVDEDEHMRVAALVAEYAATMSSVDVEVAMAKAGVADLNDASVDELREVLAELRAAQA